MSKEIPLEFNERNIGDHFKLSSIKLALGGASVSYEYEGQHITPRTQAMGNYIEDELFNNLKPLLEERGCKIEKSDKYYPSVLFNVTHEENTYGLGVTETNLARILVSTVDGSMKHFKESFLPVVEAVMEQYKE